MKFAKLHAKVAGIILTVVATTATQPVTAGQIHDVSILQHTPLQQGDFDSRMTLEVGNARQYLLLNASQVFSDSEIVRTGSQHPLTDSTSDSAIRSYQGRIENIEDSWVRITTAGQYISGVINTPTERLFITSRPKPPLNTDHRRIRNFLHATDHAIKPPPEPATERVRQTRDVIQISVDNGFQQDLVTRVARIAIVVDTLYDEALGGRGLAEAISTINTVDGMYQQEFGLALKVDTAIIITDTETLNLGDESLEKNLARFRDYRQSAAELDAELGMVHLFTGAMTSDPSVGLAYIGAACREDGYDVSMSTPFEYPVLLTAHEIGHNLGALHDDETDLCQLTTDNLMFSHISSLTTNTFSSCSTDAINKRLQQSACHLDAIDLSVTLSRNGDSGVNALITNTDTLRASPSAQLKLTLANATAASAPATCEIDSTTTEITCDIPTTYAGESQSLEFGLRFDTSAESIIDATLLAVGFIDVKGINNEARVVVPPQDNPTTTVPPVVINDDDETVTGGASAGGNSGGGSSDMPDLLLLLLAIIGVSGRRVRT